MQRLTSDVSTQISMASESRALLLSYLKTASRGAAQTKTSPSFDICRVIEVRDNKPQ